MGAGAFFAVLTFLTVVRGVLGAKGSAICSGTSSGLSAGHEEHAEADCVSTAPEATLETGVGKAQAQAQIIECIDRTVNSCLSTFWEERPADPWSCSVRRELQGARDAGEKIDKICRFLRTFITNHRGVTVREEESLLEVYRNSSKSLFDSAVSESLKIASELQAFNTVFEPRFLRLQELCQEIATYRIWSDLSSQPERTERYIQEVTDDIWFCLCAHADFARSAGKTIPHSLEGVDVGLQLKKLRFWLSFGMLLNNFLVIALEAEKVIIEKQGQRANGKVVESVCAHALRSSCTLLESVFEVYRGAFHVLLMGHLDGETGEGDLDTEHLKGLFAYTNLFVVAGRTLLGDCVDTFNELAYNLRIGDEVRCTHLMNMVQLEQSKVGRVGRFVGSYEEVWEKMKGLGPGADTSDVRRQLQVLKRKYQRAFGEKIPVLGDDRYAALDVLRQDLKHLLKNKYPALGKGQARDSDSALSPPRIFDVDESRGCRLRGKRSDRVVETGKEGSESRQQEKGTVGEGTTVLVQEAAGAEEGADSGKEAEEGQEIQDGASDQDVPAVQNVDVAFLPVLGAIAVVMVGIGVIDSILFG